ncbi:hypothetical protein [Nocardia sp.]|nr:hypothetical protein [Nocardia sp.]
MTDAERGRAERAILPLVVLFEPASGARGFRWFILGRWIRIT